MIIKYTYCNCNSGVGEKIMSQSGKCYALFKSQVVISGDDFLNLLPNTCESKVFEDNVNTCNAFAQAKISFNGYNKNYGSADSSCWAFSKARWDYPTVRRLNCCEYLL